MEIHREPRVENQDRSQIENDLWRSELLDYMHFQCG